MEPIVECRDLCFAYGKKKILWDWNLTVEPGERICFFGPSGCGKSTLLRLICGLEKPLSGVLTVRASKIRMVFQDACLLPFQTLKENTEMFAEGAPVEELLRSLNLSEALEEYPSRLSGGMARRAAIARALAAEGDLYIFDEPFNGLDEENRMRAAEEILKRTEGKTILCVMHHPEEAALLRARICEMEPWGKTSAEKTERSGTESPTGLPNGHRL